MIGRHAFFDPCFSLCLFILKGRYFTVELIRKWNEISLVKRIILGLIVGAVLGAAVPSLSVLTMDTRCVTTLTANLTQVTHATDVSVRLLSSVV